MLRRVLSLTALALGCGNATDDAAVSTSVAGPATIRLEAGVSCAPGADVPGHFRQARDALGITFEYTDHFTADGQEFSKDLGGVAIADLDGDGALDLYFANYGAADEIYVTGGRGPAQYELKRRVEPDGLANSGVVSLADLDGDGHLDALLGGNELSTTWARGDGAGGFGVPVALPQGAAFEALPVAHGFATGDLDGDGWIDVITAVHDVYTNGQNWPGREWLTRNVAGQLSDADGWVPKTRVEDMTFVCSLADLDDDGDLDVLETNDAWSLSGLGLDPSDTEVQGNRIFRNDGGTFTNVSADSGADITVSAMGVALGDYDNDGDMDLYVTSMPPSPNVLLQNHGGLSFTDETYEADADTLLPEHDVGWGTVFLDADADGWLDLFVLHGFHTAGDGQGLGPAIVNAKAQDDVILHNRGDRTFALLETADSGITGPGWGRSVAVGDLDRDGFPDVVTTNADGRPDVWLNGCDARPWLSVALESPAPNTHGIGARVRVRSASMIQTRWILGGGDGLYGMSAPEAYFGFPAGTTAVDVEVRWPDGSITQIGAAPVRHRLIATRT